MDMLDKLKTLKKKSANKVTDNNQYIVALDIGTEFVKALIGKLSGDHVEIVGVGRARQTLADMQAGAIADIAGVVGNCDKALSEAESQAGVSVRSAVIGIAGELVKGTTTTVRIRRKNPKKEIDLPEVEHIITLVQDRAREQAKRQVSLDTGGKQIEVKLVNSALIRIEIDGYGVTNPVGFPGKEVTVQLYTAFAPLVHIGALEKTAHELDLELVAVAAEPFAVARSVIGNDPNANMSAILMDVGGGTTDIAVVNDGGVEGTKMFGIGGRSFTKSIERELSISFDQAEVLKVGLSSGRTSSKNVAAVEEALAKTLDVWTHGVELALSEFPKLDHLPHRMLLCGGGASLEQLIDKLEESDWYKSLPFTKKPIIQHIKPEEVVGISDATGLVEDHSFITAMGLLRVGVDTLVQYDEQNGSIRQRLNKLLSI